MTRVAWLVPSSNSLASQGEKELWFACLFVRFFFFCYLPERIISYSEVGDEWQLFLFYLIAMCVYWC